MQYDIITNGIFVIIHKTLLSIYFTILCKGSISSIDDDDDDAERLMITNLAKNNIFSSLTTKQNLYHQDLWQTKLVSNRLYDSVAETKFDHPREKPHLQLVLRDESGGICDQQEQAVNVYLDHLHLPHYGTVSRRLLKRVQRLFHPRELPVGDPEKRRDIIEALQNAIQFRHKNIVRMMGVCFQDAQPFVVLEYATHGRLDDYLEKVSARLSQ